MVANDVVSVKFPSNATDGLELTTITAQGNPAGYTGRSHDGSTWANTSNPPALTIKA